MRSVKRPELMVVDNGFGGDGTNGTSDIIRLPPAIKYVSLHFSLLPLMMHFIVILTFYTFHCNKKPEATPRAFYSYLFTYLLIHKELQNLEQCAITVVGLNFM